MSSGGLYRIDVLEGGCMDSRPRSVTFSGLMPASFEVFASFNFAVDSAPTDGTGIREGISRLRNNASAPSMRSEVKRFMTPTVRCNVPKGRMAFSGIP